jgi:hypothetical protein
MSRGASSDHHTTIRPLSELSIASVRSVGNGFDGTHLGSRSSGVGDAQYFRGPSVSMHPGARQIHPNAIRRRQTRSIIVSRISPAFAASNADAPPGVVRSGHSAEIDAMFTIPPEPARRIASIAARLQNISFYLIGLGIPPVDGPPRTR